MTDYMMTGPEAGRIVGWNRRLIQGYAICTAIQLLVLQDLKQAQEAGYPGVYLKVHGRVVHSLLKRGWITALERPTGTLYSLTERGERARRIYSLPVTPRRYDGLCPICGQRPKEDSGYCRSCRKAYGRRSYHLRKRLKRKAAARD